MGVTRACWMLFDACVICSVALYAVLSQRILFATLESGFVLCVFAEFLRHRAIPA